jgi:glucose-1-phosphate cytidylyltransferase
VKNEDLMKVVLFCGGLGTRLRDYSDQLPKPLVPIGSRPIIWHIMKYYAHFGHKEFILCLGYGGAAIKDFFLKYEECVSNDFVFSGGGSKIELLNKDIDDWRITFVDTGPHTSIGERLRLVREHVADSEVFLANYADGVSDLNLDKYVSDFLARKKIACFLSVRVPHTFHVVRADPQQHVLELQHVTDAPLRINGGYFVLRREIFDYIKPGEELVVEAFHRLIEQKQLLAVEYDGFWRNMDTFKDKIQLDQMVESNQAPWRVWAQREESSAHGPESSGLYR